MTPSFNNQNIYPDMAKHPLGGGVRVCLCKPLPLRSIASDFSVLAPLLVDLHSIHSANHSSQGHFLKKSSSASGRNVADWVPQKHVWDSYSSSLF